MTVIYLVLVWSMAPSWVSLLSMIKPVKHTFIILIVAQWLAMGCEAQDLLSRLQAVAGEAYAVFPIEGQYLPKTVQGNPEAEVILVQYENMLCSDCRAMRQGALPRLKEAYVDSGLIRIYSSLFPVGDQADPTYQATAAFYAAEKQEKGEAAEPLFWKYGTRLTDKRYSQIAALIGMDFERFQTDRKSQEILKLVEFRRTLAKVNGVRGTPTTLVGLPQNGTDKYLVIRMEKGRPFSEYKRVIDGVLGIAIGLAGETVP